MAHMQISRSKEPIRLFKSDFLEFFTHIHPAVVAAIYAPIAAYALIAAVLYRAQGVSPVYIPVAYLLGVAVWTFAEYVLHRFVFHYRPRTPWQERLSFLFHGVHHAQPRSKTRLVMPPVVSVPLAAIFCGLFWLAGRLLGSPEWIAPLFAGFVSGYLAYDMLHYAMHHAKSKSGYLRWVRRHHMYHHTQTPDQRFGVSSPLWDWVFGTEAGSPA